MLEYFRLLEPGFGMATQRSRRDARKRGPAAGLEEAIVERYAAHGMRLLADDTPQKLDPSMRQDMESVTGADLRDVRVHTGEKARKMAEGLGARAFAAPTGDVFFAGGEFAPGTPQGKALLAHELTHVAEGHSGLARQAGRAEREEHEGRARRTEELVLAREDPRPARKHEEMSEPQAVTLPPATSPEAQGAQAQEVEIDKAELEEKTWEVMERLMKRDRERLGR